MRSYTAIIERCQDTGLYVGFIPGFQGAHTQAETLDELNKNLREVIEMMAYPLRGLNICYKQPFESVAENNWQALK
ncbi:MAG: type II toxin-antitoxin system HicB family antitoxin [Methylobacter sp.]|nr:type II toxin-antitoxin system HicB family antitoxin [Methylobacter sp.]MDP2097683.1 type II toxin-antitoxin system HicB family antitoxin [Methylobacter sp.]MDP2428816.1 type II toxin-antitoxin system HicB family antitoxin [Methylobacter sp.]MDP3054019.1 type II toxin-antitoxin system HicB family antitoxin [Methylobacter sp.]MDP3361916.1 type II toxin-antitoxin system HicB family antitoxin [Methylobacter sp.]